MPSSLFEATLTLATDDFNIVTKFTNKTENPLNVQLPNTPDDRIGAKLSGPHPDERRKNMG